MIRSRLTVFCTRSRIAAIMAMALAGSAAPGAAQLVTPKTVPVHQGEQWEIYPSSRPGLGGLSIALDDTLADPFVNPAKAARVRGGTLFGAPFAHSISGERGGGRTLSLGGIGSAGAWAVAGVGAVQQLDRAGPIWNRPTSERTANNRYLSVALARRLPAGFAAGASAFGAELGAVDGVDLLYAGSDRIDQEGSLVDLRFGLTRDWADDRTLEVMLLHNRTDVTHDVHFTDRRWDPVRRVLLVNERSEHNVDRTHIWGVHSEFSRPVDRKSVV